MRGVLVFVVLACAVLGSLGSNVRPQRDSAVCTHAEHSLCSLGAGLTLSVCAVCFWCVRVFSWILIWIWMILPLPLWPL